MSINEEEGRIPASFEVEYPLRNGSSLIRTEEGILFSRAAPGSIPLTTDADVEIMDVLDAYGDALEVIKDRTKDIEHYEYQVQQLRGALGYPVPGHIIENPSIVNGIADAISKEYAEERAAHNVHASELIEAETEVKRLREELEQVKKERDGHAEQIRVYKACDQHYREMVKPIRHLWPLENNPGIGQIVEAFQSLRSELAAKDKVLQHLADSFATYEGTCARSILSQYAKETES